MSGHEHHEAENHQVCYTVGIFFIAVMAAIIVIAIL